jgi:hypothetical protein
MPILFEETATVYIGSEIRPWSGIQARTHALPKSIAIPEALAG